MEAQNSLISHCQISILYVCVNRKPSHDKDKESFPQVFQKYECSLQQKVTVLLCDVFLGCYLVFKHYKHVASLL